jgi:ATP-dependent Lon protease
MFALTGEINIRGQVTAIGGLELKIVGGIRGGVRSFIYPEANQDDFSKFAERYKGKQAIEDVAFYPVKTIHDVFALIFV